MYNKDKLVEPQHKFDELESLGVFKVQRILASPSNTLLLEIKKRFNLKPR